MSDSKSVKMHYDVAGDDFDRAGEASAGLKRLLQKIGVPADIIRRIAIGTYEAEMNVIIHAGGGQVDAEIFPEETVVYIADQSCPATKYGPAKETAFLRSSVME